MKQCPSSAFIDCNNLDLDKSVLPENLKLEIKAAQELRKIELEKGKNTAAKYSKNLLGTSDIEEIRNKVKEGDKKNENYLKMGIDKAFESYMEDNFEISGVNIRYKNIAEIINKFEKLDPGSNALATGSRTGYFSLEGHFKYNIPKAQEVLDRFTNKKELVLNRGVRNYDTVDYMVLGAKRQGRLGMILMLL